MVFCVQWLTMMSFRCLLRWKYVFVIRSHIVRFIEIILRFSMNDGWMNERWLNMWFWLALFSTIIMHVCKRAFHTWMHNYSVVHFNRRVTKAYWIYAKPIILNYYHYYHYHYHNAVDGANTHFTCINSTNN